MGATSALAPKIGPLGLVSLFLLWFWPASRHYACLLVTEYNPVETKIDPALGSSAAHTHGQFCAERPGTSFFARPEASPQLPGMKNN